MCLVTDHYLGGHGRFCSPMPSPLHRYLPSSHLALLWVKLDIPKRELSFPASVFVFFGLLQGAQVLSSIVFIYSSRLFQSEV